jgi:hypothetical protein
MIARLRAGDEAAFIMLAEKYQATMLAVAMTHVRSTAVAEEGLPPVELTPCL